MSQFEFTKQDGIGMDLFIQGWETEVDAKGVVCLVHGLGEHGGRYAQLAETLNQAGYQVMAFDLPGHGRSGGKRGVVPPYEALCADVAMLLAAAASRYPNLPQILYGHSLGGIIVSYYTLRYQPSLCGVVVTSPGFMTPLLEQKGKMLLAKVLGRLVPEITLPSGLDATTISRDPVVVERYQKDPLVHDQASVGLAVNSMQAIRYIYENAKMWKLPLLLMHGTGDLLTYARGSQKLAELIPPGLCTLRLWEGMYHELHNEPEKEEVIAYLVTQMDKLCKA